MVIKRHSVSKASKRSLDASVSGAESFNFREEILKQVQDDSFSELVYAIVAQIPRGRVMTYGQIAALCGSPRSARIVGQVAHWGPPELPWQRVVNKSGGLAGGYTIGGREAHKRDLEADGVLVSEDYRVDVDRLIWWPAGSIK